MFFANIYSIKLVILVKKKNIYVLIREKFVSLSPH